MAPDAATGCGCTFARTTENNCSSCSTPDRPHTVLDKSLEPKLGKRIGTRCCWEPFGGGLARAGLYHSPNLYLGDTKLLTSSTVYTHDLRRIAPGLMGILGMDCLKHYCVQMDFARDRMRFLNPDLTGADDLGKPFPLTILFGLLISRADYFGTGNVWFCPDTGCVGADAVLRPSLLRRAMRQQTPVMTAPSKTSRGGKADVAGFASGVFGGQTYSNLTFVKWPGVAPSGDLLGLQFLARNLVTFNFPKRTMYLKQETAEPLASGDSVFMDARKFLSALQETNALPGWPTGEKRSGWIRPPGNNLCPTFPAALTMRVQKVGDPSNYNYIVAEQSRDAGWKLRRAWRTDASGKILTEFRVP